MSKQTFSWIAVSGTAHKRVVRAGAAGAFALSVVVLAVCAHAARAEPPTLIPNGKFEARDALGIAVDQSSSDVYTAALQNEGIDKLDALGGPIKPPSPFGGGSGFYGSVAVNPTNGDVFVADALGQAIDVYDPSSGALISSFAVSGCANGLYGNLIWSELAADAAGDVYLACAPENAVREYDPSGTLLNTLTGSGGSALKAPTGVAVDSSGDVWVADDGNNRVERFTASGSVVGAFRSEGVEALAVDTHDDVYAVVHNSADLCGKREPPCTHVVEYNATGTQLIDVAAGEIGNGLAGAPSMVAVNDATGRVYITDSENGVVWIFQPPTAPSVGRELVAEVTTSEAKLGALMSSGGIATSYRFEYGTTTAYGSVVPFPEGSVGEELVAHTVWAAASGLAPGATYHYRVVATNELGTVVGPDQTFTTLTADQVACPNEQLRGGFSAKLPDCRAYELVTPPTKTSVEFGVGHSQNLEKNGIPRFATAADGEAISFLATTPLPGAPSGSYRYLATRGTDGWSSEDIVPLQSYSSIGCAAFSDVVPEYSQELSKAVILAGTESRWSANEAAGECNAEGLQIVSGEPVGYDNLLLRDNVSGSYRLVNTPPSGVVPADAHFQGASADLSHVVFSETAPLAEGGSYGVEDLYEWDEGVVRLLTVLPDGAPVSGSHLPKALPGANAISADGSHILFSSGGALYVRIAGERTVQVDESQGAGASGGGTFSAASADGSKILFTDESRLTPDSTAAAGEPDLYECALVEGVDRCELSDLTVAKAGEHADVQRVSVLGAKDSTHVYFVATGVLASNTGSATDAAGNQVGEKAEDGQRNLYMWHDGVTTFIARFGEYDFDAGQASPDGEWFLFQSTRSLTGNYGAEELFLYSASSGRLVCASCNPTGEVPIPFGGASIQNGVGSETTSQFAPRYVSSGGRVFFETNESLVPADTNGQIDVYEYEHGHLYLVSTGTSATESNFIDASESGDDIFFLARQQLVPQDTQEGMRAIYDARVDGGFPFVSSPPPCVTADACRAAVSPQPVIYGAPSSQTFSGVGNLTSQPETKSTRTVRKKAGACKRRGGAGKRAACRAKGKAAKHHKRKAKSHKGGR